MLKNMDLLFESLHPSNVVDWIARCRPPSPSFPPSAPPKVLLALLKKDPLRLFAEPVLGTVTGYHERVLRPMDFGRIRRRTLAGEYASTKGLTADVRQLCNNAIGFNLADSIYSVAALGISETLGKCLDLSKQWTKLIHQAHKRHFMQVRHDRSLRTDNDAIFAELRVHYPHIVRNFEHRDVLRAKLEANFIRTEENEVAYYGSLAIRRATCAALSPAFLPAPTRSPADAAAVAAAVDAAASRLADP